MALAKVQLEANLQGMFGTLVIDGLIHTMSLPSSTSSTVKTKEGQMTTYTQFLARSAYSKMVVKSYVSVIKKNNARNECHDAHIQSVYAK